MASGGRNSPRRGLEHWPGTGYIPQERSWSGWYGRREPKDHLGVPFLGMTHSLSRRPRLLPIKHPISLYPYLTRTFQGFDGNQGQRGKLSSRTRALSQVLDAPSHLWKLTMDTWILSSFILERLHLHQCHIHQGQCGVIEILKVASAINGSVLGLEGPLLLIIGSRGIFFGHVLRKSICFPFFSVYARGPLFTFFRCNLCYHFSSTPRHGFCHRFFEGKDSDGIFWPNTYGLCKP